METGDINASEKPPTSRRMKPRAPPPPGAPQPAPRKIFTAPRNAVPDGGMQSGDTKENMLSAMVDLHVTLPDGFQTAGTVDGSKALMDLLVDLCSRYHLNPACHTLELLSPDGRAVAFKPNALVGALGVRSVLLKEKVPEEKLMRKPLPKVPEKTVRLIVNYHRTQKAVVRVSPLVPLGSLVPVICEKCEFDPSHVILLKDNISNHEMDLDKSLNELGVREIYVLDQKLVLQAKMASAPVLNYSESFRSNTLSNSSDKKGFLGFFNFSRQKAKSSFKTPSSPCMEARPNTLGQSQSVMNIPRMSPKAELKKRRAPPPPQPTPALCEVRSSVESCQVRSVSPSGSQQKKRRAPAPPAIAAPGTPAEDDSASERSPAHSAGHSERGGSVRSTSSCSSSGLGGDTVPQTTPSDNRSALELKLEEGENNRHSTLGSEQQVPLKPRRTPTREPPTLVIPPPPPDSPPPSQPSCHDAQLESDSEAQAQPWLHSLQGSEPNLSPEQESETGSVGSGCSLPDQGYAPSEGTAEDSPFVSSPSDLTHPASPDGSVSPDGGPAPPRARSRALAKDSSSDSDEGCATWGSRHRHSNKIYPMEQADRMTDRMTDSYEDDAELSTQLHQTLAELEADLADVEHTDQASVSESSISSSEKSYHNEIPVSVLHLEVPVTAINEVLEDQELGRANYEDFQSSDTLFARNQILTYKPHRNIWTRTDTVNTVNSHSKAGTSSPHVMRSVSVPQKEIEEVMAIPVTEIRDGLCKGDSCTDPPILKRQSQQLGSSARSVPSSPPRSPEHQTTCQGEIRTPTVEDETPRAMKSQMPQSTITQSPTSRFGLKTFTVIPPKPALNNTQKPAGSLVTGAIKIDALGNMVMQQNTYNKYGSSPGSGSDTELPLLEKAKAFWNSAEQQDGIPAPQSAVLKTKDPQFTRPAPAAESAGKVRPEESLKDVVEAPRSIIQEVECNPLTSEPSQHLTKSTKEPQLGRDLSFLKPPRRTSSQYVASAIAKYTGMPSTRMETKQESNTKTESTVFKPRFFSTKSIINGDRSINVTSNGTNYNVNEDTIQMNGKCSSSLVANPKRSLSFPEYTTERKEGSTVGKMDRTGKLGTFQGGASANSLNADRGNMGFSTSAPIQVDTLVSVADRIASPALSAKGTDGPLVDGDPSSSAFPESRQVGVFGPVQKFRPVILKAVPEDTTLHSTLMEAIQSGHGKERLKKVSDTREGSLRAASYVTAENERCALLAAIRAQNNSSRLRKTGSEAANELEGFRKSEGNSRFPSESMFPLPPSVPPPPSHAPPPPPQPLTPIVPISMSTARNPEGARQALLEAIRSGLGAERLKKVPVPTKTVLVNGRLGTMRASSSIAQEH
ncbi:protein cordon-bleu isoform X1 [Scleropages formosus]|uniref:Cordon-bleu WH2 repeat protein n=1 Tax=Scleropages formosus TaxID=113540 RepID=A0A8C9R257_SCLFO|nr:protein cordon-bleu isoform X1 [Scleropages formosus]